MNRFILKPKFLLSLSMAMGLFILPSFAQATGIVATGGDVIVTFGNSDAGYTSKLFLGTTEIMSNRVQVGTTFNLGSFAAGTSLDFRIEVQNTGHSFYMGTGAANIDGFVHAKVNDLVGSTQVGWEDLLNGGDQDYNDLVFTFSNTMECEGDECKDVLTDITESGDGYDGNQKKLIANPEPSTMILFGSGLLGLGAWRLRKKRA